MPGGAAAEHAAEGLIAKAAKAVLHDAVGASERDGAKDAAESTAKHVGEKADYEFNMIENPGPLSTTEYGRAAQNYAGGRYDMEVTQEDRVLFRAGKHDDKLGLGQYYTEDPPVGELQARMDNAVEKFWLDGEHHYNSTTNYGATSLIDTGFAVHIPKGTTIFQGPVASRGGNLVGGAKDQIFIRRPWEIDGLHAIDSWPLA